MMSKAELPVVIFLVVDSSEDPQASITVEIALTNHLLSLFPGAVILSRSNYLMAELMAYRAPQEWADVHVKMIEISDVVYAHEGFRDHPLIDYAEFIGVDIVDDEWDLGSCIANLVSQEK